MIQVGPPTVNLQNIRNMLKTIPNPFTQNPTYWDEWTKAADSTLEHAIYVAELQDAEISLLKSQCDTLRTFIVELGDDYLTKTRK